MEDVDLDSLLALVAESLGYRASFPPDGATLNLTGPRTLSVRLTGLRKRAARQAREDWPTLVSEHLAHAVAVADEPLDAGDLDQIRPLLRVRLCREEEAANGRVVGRRLSTGLAEILTLGYGGAPRPVRPEEAGCWPVPATQALDLALRNARDDERPSVSRHDLGGVPVWRLDTDGAGVSAHLRHLEDHLPMPPGGVLAALPAPGTLLVHPVENLGVVRAIERLRLAAQRESTGRDDGLSPQVYWWRQDRLTLIRADLVTTDDQVRLVVTPPPEFARVLAGMARRPG